MPSRVFEIKYEINSYCVKQVHEWINSKGLSFPDSGGRHNINFYFTFTVRFNQNFVSSFYKKESLVMLISW